MQKSSKKGQSTKNEQTGIKIATIGLESSIKKLKTFQKRKVTEKIKKLIMCEINSNCLINFW